MSGQQQQLTHSTPPMFYAVSWGHQRGVFGSFKDAQAAMKGFPSPIYKKFKSREEAESFVDRSKPESTSMDVDDSFTKFFAVARGRIVGIFKDLETVKKNIKGYPNAMHKKFDKLDEAQHYLEKYFEGKAADKKSPKKSLTSESADTKEEMAKQTADGGDATNVEMGDKEQTKEEDESGAKPVARKRTYGTKVNDGPGEKESELDSSEGQKALREEEPAREEGNTDAKTRDEASGVEEQGKKEDESMESEESVVNGEQQTAVEDAKTNQKMEEEGEKDHQKMTTSVADKHSAKKAKLEDTGGTAQTSQQ